LKVEVQLENRLFRVKQWPGDPARKARNWPFSAYDGPEGAWQQLKKDAPWDRHETDVAESTTVPS